MMVNNDLELSDVAIVEKGTSVLLRELGYSGFIQYLRLLTKGNNDYLKIQDKIYEGMSLDEIFNDASEHWKRKQ